MANSQSSEFVGYEAMANQKFYEKDEVIRGVVGWEEFENMFRNADEVIKKARECLEHLASDKLDQDAAYALDEMDKIQRSVYG